MPMTENQTDVRDAALHSRKMDIAMLVGLVGLLLADMSPIVRDWDPSIAWSAAVVGVCLLSYGFIVIWGIIGK